MKGPDPVNLIVAVLAPFILTATVELEEEPLSTRLRMKKDSIPENLAGTATVCLMDAAPTPIHRFAPQRSTIRTEL
jgi:hypothetical protein